ncbi:hypothetical protein PR202_gb28682 [Eleusine coracana subsp. coracana]|uniref:Uncharacterized protein n=1 Tax=Eleusine coracana subsp. coracana TaxID=191504 RepID=A0AAV5FZF6_ELECO|nr:hypothetical protein QOZ80_8BG0646540 [Eleusine coracana subsp. coracana]GJN39556.1 hypothetical protein PR202_gb28682 [Eleusine coracana subsp. coracana]
MPPPSVKILEESRVAVPATAALPPEPLVLSALDAMWIALPLIQRLLIFVDDDESHRPIPPFASVVAALRASLAETAARFPVMAGQIVHVPATGDAAIDCADGGVRFNVAEMGHVDARRLAEDEDHDADAFRRLVPVLDAGQLPAEAMAAQVTRLRGGVALGVAMHHVVVDGRSVWRFIQAWAAACRGEDDADLAAHAPPPTFDRKAIRLPGGEELARSVLRKYTPNLPKAADMKAILVRPNLSRRTFTISMQQINRLKQRITDHSSFTPLSSFVAVVALAWVSFVRARHPDVITSLDDEVTLFFFADCRARLDPPPGDGFFGTCISGCQARAIARDLLLDDDDSGSSLARAAAAVAAEVRRAAEEPLALWDTIMSQVERVDMDIDRLVIVSGSTRFPAYQAADFGWGPPARTELVTMNHDGQVVLVGGKDGDGGVQASVSLNPAHMDAFKSCFYSYVG